MSLRIARELVSVAKRLIASTDIIQLIGDIGKNMTVQITTPDEGKVMFVGKFNGNQTEFWPRRNSSIAMLVQNYYIRIKWTSKRNIEEILPGQKYILEIDVATAGGHSGFFFEVPFVVGPNPERDMERLLRVVIPAQINQRLKKDAKHLMEVADSISKKLIQDYNSGRYMGD